MSRWLVTGAAGMLGHDVVDAARQAGHEVRGTMRADLDIRDPHAALATVADFDVIVNCAAWTDVDGAESHEAEAFAVNAVGAANLARACDRAGAVMVQISTDYVFSGDASEPYPVDAPLCPINAYGRTKAAGEWAVRTECPHSYIVRTSWLYGAHGRNFVTTILQLAREHTNLNVVADQQGQPTWTRDVSASVVGLLEDAPSFGTFHLAAKGSATWYDVARATFELVGLDSRRITACRSDSVCRPATRPAYSVLAPSKDFLSMTQHWRSRLQSFLQLSTVRN